MQFHFNGFHAGDPDVFAPAAGHETRATTPPAEVDVLIVGCGPAGLTLAAQLAAFPDITTRIVEQKPGPMEKGQADGISCRSMEMFQAFGFAEKIRREACWVNETSFWTPDPQCPDRIHRTGRIQDVEDGLSEMPHVILNQARVHDRFLEIMRNAPTRLEPDYNCQVTGLTVDHAASDHPVTVSLRRTDTDQVETVRARYVVGCDGARSAVRSAIGRELRGDRANQAWGVMDVLAVTDYPDYRMKSLVKSAGKGNILLIPREGGHMVRLYIELDELAEDQRISAADMQVETLIDATRRVLHPYKFDVKEVVWWSVYEVGHRLTDKFDDLPDDAPEGQTPRVFIAGDACHTHSAKAGQGMNVSMGDTFNLGWKLIAVLQERCTPALLRSYSEERQAVARDLIEFDHEWARIIGAPAETGATPNAAPKFQVYFIEHGRYTAGVSVKYRPSALIGTPDWQHLATGFEIGTRFHSAPVVRLADAKPMHLGHTVTADARWRLFAFAGAGDPTSVGSGIGALCDFLTHADTSPLRVHTPAGADPDAVIDLRAVFQNYHRDLDLNAMPGVLMPKMGRLGLTDYEKMFCVDRRAGDIYALRGVDRERGCMVIVRPDQHVAQILPLDGFAALSAFFAGVFT
ncbi:MAG: FAD-binding monooxygenase [Rhodobacteraceae bacterium]|jgi:phenol 2-monooxygenase|nr:FAD-binding monooxygenase [Paracoccaceae bacterium]